MQLYIPDPITDDERAALAWWNAMRPETRLVFLQAAWELEGCETPEQLEPHQRKEPVEGGRACGGVGLLRPLIEAAEEIESLL